MRADRNDGDGGMDADQTQSAFPHLRDNLRRMHEEQIEEWLRTVAREQQEPETPSAILLDLERKR
jgi:hypothetical protein